MTSDKVLIEWKGKKKLRNEKEYTHVNFLIEKDEDDKKYVHLILQFGNDEERPIGELDFNFTHDEVKSLRRFLRIIK